MKLRADNLTQTLLFSLTLLCGVDNGVPQLPQTQSESFDQRHIITYHLCQYIRGPVSHNNGTLKIHLCLRLPGAVSMDVLHFAFLRVTQTAPEVTGTENLVTSNLPFLLDSSGMAKMLSKSLVTDSPLLLLLLLLLLYQCQAMYYL